MAKFREWIEMYCVESHGLLTKGTKYLVKINGLYNSEVKIRGKIIYSDPRYFQLNKPVIKEIEEDDDYDSYEYN